MAFGINRLATISLILHIANREAERNISLNQFAVYRKIFNIVVKYAISVRIK